MKIDFSQNDGVLQIAPDGRLDTTTAPELERFLHNNLQNEQALIINCEKLIYISSAGLRVLLAAQKKTKGAMKLTGVGELVMEVLEMTGFADILTIE